MSGAKHTPGPWDLHTDEPDLMRGHVGISSKGHALLAQVVWRLDGHGHSPDCEANARLIAAAPELLEALRLFIGSAFPVATEINQRGHNWSEAYLDSALTTARAALAKATGSTL